MCSLGQKKSVQFSGTSTLFITRKNVPYRLSLIIVQYTVYRFMNGIKVWPIEKTEEVLPAICPRVSTLGTYDPLISSYLPVGCSPYNGVSATGSVCKKAPPIIVL